MCVRVRAYRHMHIQAVIDPYIQIISPSLLFSRLICLPFQCQRCRVWLRSWLVLLVFIWSENRKSSNWRWNNTRYIYIYIYIKVRCWLIMHVYTGMSSLPLDVKHTMDYPARTHTRLRRHDHVHVDTHTHTRSHTHSLSPSHTHTHTHILIKYTHAFNTRSWLK